MPMDQQKTERNSEIKKLRDSGMTYKAISKKLGITVNRVRQIYERMLFRDKQTAIKNAFPGFDWFPAYGIYEEDITSIGELKSLSDEELFDVLNRAYPFRDNVDIFKQTKLYINSIKEAETDAAE